MADLAHLQFIQPAHFARPRGYSNGIVATGRTLYVAGQIGWEPGAASFAALDFSSQFIRALDNVIDVVRAAGGEPQHLVKMTVYVTDLEAYRRSLGAIGAAWRERLGSHFPAMALVAVAGLVEPGATVEIEAIAVLPG